MKVNCKTLHLFFWNVFNSKLIFRYKFILLFLTPFLWAQIKWKLYQNNLINLKLFSNLMSSNQLRSIASKEASPCREKKRGKSMRHTCKLLSWRNRLVSLPSDENLKLAELSAWKIQTYSGSFLGEMKFVFSAFSLK